MCENSILSVFTDSKSFFFGFIQPFWENHLKRKQTNKNFGTWNSNKKKSWKILWNVANNKVVVNYFGSDEPKGILKNKKIEVKF